MAVQVVKDLYAQCQSAWFKLLGFLAFFGIVILSTTDADFLSAAKQTEIPLIGIEVPSERFFYLAALVATTLYCYLHYYCLKLWILAQTAEQADLEGAESTLIGDLVIDLHPTAAARGGEGWGAIVLLGLLLWASHPLLLVLALLRSKAAGDRVWDFLEGAPWIERFLLPHSVDDMLLACLAVSVAVGTVSLLAALAIRWRWLRRRPVLWPLAFAIAIPVFFGATQAALPLRKVSIDRLNLAGLGPDWRAARDRREEFRTAWCAREGRPRDICANMPRPSVEASRVLRSQRIAYCLGTWKTRNAQRCLGRFERQDADFLAEWHATRNAQVDALTELDLTGRDLAGVSAAGTRFVNARLERANFARATLVDADFEDAEMKAAELTGADAYYATFDRGNLTDARLALADLTAARFEGAALVAADLRGAKLVDADFTGANLAGADLRGADLSDARFYRADLTGARLDGAVLKGTNFDGATGLFRQPFRDALTDRTSRLPPGPKATVAGCWPALPASVSAALDAVPLPGSGRAEMIRDAYLAAHVCAAPPAVRTADAGTAPPPE